MQRTSTYQTRQRGQILEYLKSLDGGHITAADIAGYFEGSNAPVGKTTVYRHLEKLTGEGRLRRYFLTGEKSACYQYIAGGGKCKTHFHLKCETCGKLFHLDCGLLEDAAGHIQKKHCFAINQLKTVFYGTCKHCKTCETTNRVVEQVYSGKKRKKA